MYECKAKNILQVRMHGHRLYLSLIIVEIKLKENQLRDQRRCVQLFILKAKFN